MLRFNYTDIVKFDGNFLPELLFLSFALECNISNVNLQFGIENREYLQSKRYLLTKHIF